LTAFESTFKLCQY